jgi:hypothetical protein
MAEVIDRSRPLPISSATVLCCTSQTEVAEGLLLGECPAHVVNEPRVRTRWPIYKYCTYQGARGKLPPLSPPIYK